MAYAAWSTAGMKLYVTISGSASEVKGVESISVSPGQKPQIDTTAIGDTTSSSVVGVPAPGTLNFSIMYDPTDAVHGYLLAAFNTAGSVNDTWKVTMKDQTDAWLTFTGYIQSFDWSFEKNAAGKASISVSLSSGVSVLT